MDKNTITGLVLIGILLVGFSFLSRPSEEQIAAQKRYYDSIAVVQQQEEALRAKTEAALANEKEETAADSASLFFNATKGKEAFTTIQNNLVEITLDNKGGRVYSALLKNYMGQDKKPVVLFNGSDASMNFNFYNKKGALQTKDFYFEAVNKTDSSVTMRLAADSASYIDFIYTLKPDNYLMSFVIKLREWTENWLPAQTMWTSHGHNVPARSKRDILTKTVWQTSPTNTPVMMWITFRQVKTTKSPFRNVWTGSLSRISSSLPYSSQNRISKRLRLNRKWRNREAVT